MGDKKGVLDNLLNKLMPIAGGEQRAYDPALYAPAPGPKGEVFQPYMAKVLTEEEHQAMLEQQARQVYGDKPIDKLLRRNARIRGGQQGGEQKGILFPSHSTLPGYPGTFMMGPDGRPAGFSGYATDPLGKQLPGAAPTTYRTPATTAVVPPEVGSAQWDVEQSRFLENQYRAKKAAGEKLPSLDDYIVQGLVSGRVAGRTGGKVKELPAGNYVPIIESQARAKGLPYKGH